ncbi:MAG: DUF1272 domain-containing protein [Kordiimonadaceae bacterium]|nr:DUF1272 domain-containing protein [Kordiimonadaceae bacterium]
MLELRPSCEHCDKKLPPNCSDARICSYECTFCLGCAEGVLAGVCPNCGGGFTKRPIRPQKEWKQGLSSGKQPPSDKRVYKPVNVAAHKIFAAAICIMPAEER